MNEPLIVAMSVEPAATRVTLWQGGARRFDERIAHGVLALAHGAAPAPARRRVRLDATRELLARYGEDALRPDAFVAMGAGAPSAGVYTAAPSGDDEASDGAALVAALAAESGAHGFVVEPLGNAEDEISAGAERLLLARSAVRRHVFDAPGTGDAARVVVSLEPHAMALAVIGDRIVATVWSVASLDEDAERLVRQMTHGDAAAAETLATFAEAVARAALESAEAVPNVHAVLLTGSLAVQPVITQDVARILRTLAPVRLLPAERIERALADLAAATLIGLEPLRAYGG